MPGGRNRIDFEIGFSTDESGLKKLQANLTQIMNIGSGKDPLKGLTEGERQAIQNASLLKDALQKAYNADLGTTNISKVNSELNKSGVTINQCRESFRNLGAQGANAYNLLGTQILSTNVKIKQTNKLLDKMAVTMANTIRFGISSSIFNNATGALSKAVGYAEDLNESLTSIRIVSGQSAEQMQKFAVQANDAAKSLGATTLDYTDASLIYYQQGLGQEEVEERTNVTLEMANVLGTSAKEVSNYMTAIWNNFDDGSKSLEYYGDVIAKLGATTASSAEEIADGLEKFAAIGDTVGLSYEYATASLATVVAETRQSADTVGTAFKTIFARLQGLELGETLEDGTDLNKYSLALSKVGISIKDQNGELKKMDDILNEMGAKWKSLGEDQQVALAETVAGTRQYAQLVALMKNWDKVTENIEVAKNATGTLAEQQEIYMESTEAKLKTLKATWQDLYGGLVKSDELNAGIEALTSFVQVFDDFFDSFGGGIKSISAFGIVLSGVFNKQLSNAVISFKDRLQEAQQNAELLAEKSAVINAGKYYGDMPLEGQSQAYQADYNSQVDNAKNLLQISGMISQDEYNRLTTLQSEIGALEGQKAACDYLIKKEQDRVYKTKECKEQHEEIFKEINKEGVSLASLEDKYSEQLDKAQKQKQALEEVYQKHQDQLQILGTETNLTKEQSQVLNKIVDDIIKETNAQDDFRNSLENVKKGQSNINEVLDEEIEKRRELVELNKRAVSTVQKKNDSNNFDSQAKDKQTDLDTSVIASKKNAALAGSFSLLTTSLSTVTTAWMSLNSVVDTWNDKDLTSGQKTLRILMALSTTLPVVVSNFANMKKALSEVNIGFSTYAALSKANLAIQEAQLAIETAENAQLELKAAKEYKAALIEEMSILTKKEGNLTNEEALRLIAMTTLLEQAETDVEKAEIAVLKANTDATTANARAREANAAAARAEQGSIKTGMAALTKETGKKLVENKFGLTKIADGAKGTWQALTGVMEGFGFAAGEAVVAAAAFCAIIAALTAAIVALVIVHKKKQEAIQNEIDSLDKTISKHSEMAKKYKEEADAMDELTSAYEDLIKRREEGTISEKNARLEAYKLCDQYGLESLKVQALTGDYQNLTTAIKEAQAEKYDKAAKENKATIDNIAQQGQYQAAKDSQHWYNSLGKDLDETTIYSAGGPIREFLSQLTGTVLGGSIGALAGPGAIGMGAIVGNSTVQSITSDDERDFLNSKYGSVISEGAMGSASVNVKEALLKAAKDENYEDAVKQYAEAGADDAKQLYKILQDNQEKIKEIRDNLDEYEKNIKESIIAKTSQNVKDVTSYIEQVNKAAEKAVNEGLFDDENDAREWAESAMAQDPTAGAYAAEGNAILTITTKLKGSNEKQEELAEKLATGELTQQQIAYLLIKVGYQNAGSMSEDEIMNILNGEEAEKIVRITTDTSSANDIEDILMSIHANGELTSTDIDALANNKGFLDSIGQTEKEFRKMCEINTESAQALVESYFDKVSEKVKQTGQEDINFLNQQLENLETRKNSIKGDDTGVSSTLSENGIMQGAFTEDTAQDFGVEEAAQAAKESYDNLLTYVAENPITYKQEDSEVELQITREQVAAIEEKLIAGQKLIDAEEEQLNVIAQKLAADTADKEAIMQKFEANKMLSASEEKTKDKIIEQSKKIKDQIELYGDAISTTQAFADEQGYLENAIENAQDAMDTYAENIARAKANTEKANKGIDDIQSSFDTLNGAIEQYNKNGYMTMDTMQALLSLEDEYFDCLEIQGNQISLNEEAMRKMTLAKIDALEAAALLEYQTQLETLANLDAEESALQLARSILETGNAASEAQGQIAQYTARIKELQAAIAEGGNPLIQEAAAKLDERYQKKHAIYEQMRKGASTSSGFKKMMSKNSGKSSGSKKEKKEKKEKDTKDYDEEFDRYRDINKQLELIADALEKVDKIQEHVFGKQLIQSLKNENKLLREQKKAQEQLLSLQKQQRAEMQSKLGAAGGQFDANGHLTNYASLTQSVLAQYNQKVAEYNAGSIDDKAFSAFEKQYNDLKKTIDEYDKLDDKIRETEKAIEEYEQKVRDNNLKAWEIDLELKLNKKVLERQWNDFLHKINTDFKKVYSDLGKELSNIQKNSKTYVGKKGTINTDINAIKDVEKEIDKIMKGGKSDKFASLSEAQEKLKELNQQLMDDGDALYEMYQKAYETYLEDIDQYADKLDEINRKYERITADLEHQGKLMELVYGDKAYAMMDKLYTAQINTSKGQIDSYKQQYEAYKKQYEAAAKGSKEQKKFYDLMCQAQDNYNASLEKTVELLQTKFKNAINAAFDELEKSLTNGIGFDEINDEWDKLIEHQNKYYDKTETLYQAQTLANKVTKQMEDLSGNLKAQQKLQDFYDTHINQMREKSEISKKQVEYENQALAVLQAEIALEEAQNAKNSMKMVRGTDGNWSYQYTADDDATEEKKQNLLDEMNGLYLLAREGYQECVESMTKVEQERVQKLKEIAEDTVLTEEEKIAKMKEVNDYYDAEQKRLKEEMAQWELNLHVAEAEEMLGLYENDIENYSYMTEEQKTLLDEVKKQGIQDFIDMEEAMKGNIGNIYKAADDAIKETVPAWTSGAAEIAKSWSGNPDSVEKMVDKCISECIKATQNYEKEIDKLGISMDNLTAAIEDDEEATKALQDATEEMTDAMEEGLERDREALAEVESAWESVKGSIESAIESLREYLKLMQDIKDVEAQQISPTGGGADLGGGGSSSGGSGSGSGSGSRGSGNNTDSKKPRGWWIVGYDTRGYAISSENYKYGSPQAATYEAGLMRKQGYKVNVEAYYKSGGYTGEWNNGDDEMNGGKLAFLHQKELVLNKTDTQNMLDTINTVRDIQSTSGAIDQAIMKSIAGMVAKMAGLSPSSTNGITNSTTSTDNSQVIYNVEANFPNAGDIIEIQQAILSLPNLARQQGSLNKK